MSDERDPIEYLINAMENAAQSGSPAAHNYAGKRQAVLAAIRALRSEKDALLRELQRYRERKPVAWRREWQGDVSDIGLWVYDEEPQAGPEWQALYTKPEEQ